MSTRIGDRNKIIDVQMPTKVSDNIGGYTVTWTTKYSGEYAALWPVSSRDIIQSDKMTGTITHRIRMTYKRILKSDWRIKFGNRYFAIVGPPININEANIDLELLCKETEG